MPQLSFMLTQQEYESLIALARKGTTINGQVNPDAAQQLDSFLRFVEKKNGVTRDAVWVQWQNAREPLPPTTRFPEVWPPENRYFIEFVSTTESPRRVSRADVDVVLQQKAKDPVNVLITKDPGARVGWTELGSFFT